MKQILKLFGSLLGLLVLAALVVVLTTTFQNLEGASQPASSLFQSPIGTPTQPPYPPPVTSTPQPTPTTTPPIPSQLAMDAKTYAVMMGVDMNEAIRRLYLQKEIGELNKKLFENEGDTFAGLWIQHKPYYRIMISFTHDGEATLRSYVWNTSLADIVELHEATVTLRDLETVRFEAAHIANELGIPASSAISVSTNRAELYVLNSRTFEEELAKARIQLPNYVEVIEFTELPRKVADILGGKALTSCTSGFSVLDSSSGIRGVTTAGHCSNSQSYNGVNLPFMSGTPDTGGIYDIQWHRGDHAFTVRNLIWDGTYNRYIHDVKFRSSQSMGEWVCKYGKTTGYACGTIATTSQDGVNVRVDYMTVQGGDSGGPWFWNNTAYGTTISTCSLSDGTPCAIYGPVDQIYNILGLVVLPIKIHLPLVIK